MRNKGLYEKLIEYRNNNKYPFHMPGHKREYKMFDQIEISKCEDTINSVVSEKNDI